MHICTITSCEIPRFEGSEMHMGVYELGVTVNLRKAQRSGDPRGYIQHQISTALHGCIRHTGIPLNERAWEISFTEAAMKMFNFPARFKA